MWNRIINIQGLWAIENKKFDYAKECLESAGDKIKKSEQTYSNSWFVRMGLGDG